MRGVEVFDSESSAPRPYPPARTTTPPPPGCSLSFSLPHLPQPTPLHTDHAFQSALEMDDLQMTDLDAKSMGAGQANMFSLQITQRDSHSSEMV